MSTAVIVQARMGSTRLPGKVLREIGGRTVLAHVLQRSLAIPGIDLVCCATVDGPEGDAIAAEAQRCGAQVHRGSETDVLARYHGAARALGADVIVRVMGDCPLLDPDLCAQVLQLHAKGADYACNTMPPSWPVGLDCEAFGIEWLERAAREARAPYEREHVTPWLRNHPKVRIANLSGPGEFCVDYRWSLQTAADLRFLRALFRRLPQGRDAWDYRLPLAICNSDPRLAAVNTGQIRNANGRPLHAVGDFG